MFLCFFRGAVFVQATEASPALRQSHTHGKLAAAAHSDGLRKAPQSHEGGRPRASLEGFDGGEPHDRCPMHPDKKVRGEHCLPSLQGPPDQPALPGCRDVGVVFCGKHRENFSHRRQRPGGGRAAVGRDIATIARHVRCRPGPQFVGRRAGCLHTRTAIARRLGTGA